MKPYFLLSHRSSVKQKVKENPLLSNAQKIITFFKSKEENSPTLNLDIIMKNAEIKKLVRCLAEQNIPINILSHI